MTDAETKTVHFGLLPGVLRRARLRDRTRYGIPDSLQAGFGLVHAVTFDVDQSSMDGLAPDGELSRSGALDTEVSLVRRGPGSRRRRD